MIGLFVHFSQKSNNDFVKNAKAFVFFVSKNFKGEKL